MEEDVENLLGLQAGLREERRRGVVEALRKLADDPISFTFNPQGTQLYSIEEVKRAYARRFVSMSESSQLMMQGGDVVSAVILARALIETVAVGCFFASELERLIKAGDLDNFDKKITRFLVGSSTGEVKRIHINDALRHLHEIDQKYLTYLWDKYPDMKVVLSKLTQGKVSDPQLDDMKAAISITSNYDLLSEIAHPNGLGTFYIYGQPENRDEAFEHAEARLRSLVEAASWQGHHLESALNKVRTSSKEYLRKFGLPDAG